MSAMGSIKSAKLGFVGWAIIGLYFYECYVLKYRFFDLGQRVIVA
jgi:hypothetical protein